jgi:hypothetical protein
VNAQEGEEHRLAFEGCRALFGDWNQPYRGNLHSVAFEVRVCMVLNSEEAKRLPPYFRTALRDHILSDWRKQSRKVKGLDDAHAEDRVRLHPIPMGRRGAL